MEEVVLVDELDNDMGTMEKLEAHRKGLLHRAFSVLLFNSKNEVLLQKRAQFKYHSGGLWTNTCCSHPLPGETMEHAIERKLVQEMGIRTPTRFAFKFLYKVNLDHDLAEHELDHVYTGFFDGTPVINNDEVEDWKFCSLQELTKDVAVHPARFTTWFRLIMNHPEIEMLMVS